MSIKCTFCPECSYYSVCSFHLLKEQSLYYLNAIELINSRLFALRFCLLSPGGFINLMTLLWVIKMHFTACLNAVQVDQIKTSKDVFHFIFSKYMKNKMLKIIQTVNKNKTTIKVINAHHTQTHYVTPSGLS